MIKKVGYFKYDTEDVIGKCVVCGGDLVEEIAMAHRLNLSESQRLDLESGIYTIAYCPTCLSGSLQVVPVRET